MRTVGPADTDAVYAAAQDPDIQRWTTVPSPYLYEHARGFVERQVPDGWADGSMCTFGLFLRHEDLRHGDLPHGEPPHEDLPHGDLPHGELTGMLGVTMRSLGTAEIGFWAVKEHRGNGYVAEAAGAVARWAFTRLGVDRLEWRAEVGNRASRAVAERVGFTVEGTLRAALNNKGVLRDCWVGSLLPSDLSLASTAPYLPARG
ncbi:acetyltransferase [Streptomyces sp. e14]|nr:acetyltransferase [Streptomyces sp. e14]